METVTLDSLRTGISFTGDILLDSTFILLPKSAEVTDSLIKALNTWKFESFLCDGNVSLEGDIEITEDDAFEQPQEKVQEEIGVNIKKAIENSKQHIFDNSDRSRMEAVQNVYNEYMNYIEQLFNRYTTHNEINKETLSDTVQQLCVFIKENRRYILRVTPNTDLSPKNYIVSHAMRSTVLAIAIALQLRMPLSKMIDLGVTCILHEIGMLRLPPQLYNTTKKLTPGQRAHIAKHTVFGYTILKDLNFPTPIQLGVLEHHEKENGLGYPRRLPSEKIEPIAKIISVACSYEAISSPRTYRDERTTFDALLEMIQNKEHAYDDSVLKALLYTVSLYPIGTYVYLSNRKIAVVVDSNHANPKCPVVQLLSEKEADGSPKTIQTDENLNILRVLSKKEKEDIIKVIEQKENAMEEAKNIAENNNISDKKEEAAPVTQKAIPIAQLKKEAVKKSADGTEEVDISFFN